MLQNYKYTAKITEHIERKKGKTGLSLTVITSLKLIFLLFFKSYQFQKIDVYKYANFKRIPESQGQGSLVGCRLWGHTESDTTEVT